MLVARSAPSLKSNVVFGVIQTVSQLIYPLITFPYLSRVLEPDGFGLVTWVSSVVANFAVFASLGFATYGLREAARLRDNQLALIQFTTDLFFLNSLSTAFAIVVLWGSLLLVPALSQHRLLIAISGTSLLFSLVGVDWLYAALERYRYIALRTVLFQLLGIVLIFSLVKTPSDTLPYVLITVVTAAGSSLWNILNARRFFRRTVSSWPELRLHLGPVIVLFVSGLAGAIFNNLNVVILGLVSSNLQVGYWAAGSKINRILIALVTSANAVLLPRISYYHHVNSSDRAHVIFERTMGLVLLVAVPMAVGSFLLSGELVAVLAGPAFADAALVLKILAPQVIVVAVSNGVLLHFLLPTCRERPVAVVTVVAAVLSLVGNLALVAAWESKATALMSLATEVIICFGFLTIARRSLPVRFILKRLFIGMCASVIMTLAVLAVQSFHFTPWLSLVLGTSMGALVYTISLALIKDETFLYAFRLVMGPLVRNRLSR